MNINDITTKIENQGTTSEGKLTAEEFNTLVDTVKNNTQILNSSVIKSITINGDTQHPDSNGHVDFTVITESDESYYAFIEIPDNYKNTNIAILKDVFKVPIRYKAIKSSLLGFENVSYKGTLIIETSTDGGINWSKKAELKNILTSYDYEDDTSVDVIDLYEYISNGTQQVKLTAYYVYQNKTIEKTIDLGKQITKTSLELTIQTDIHTPIYAFDSNNNTVPFQVSYYIYGAINKKFKAEIIGSSGTTTVELTSPNTEDGQIKNVSISDTSEYGLMTHGVKYIKAWLEAEDGLGNTESSNILVNRVMVVNPTTPNADLLKPYLLLQNVVSKITNYVQTSLCEYAAYIPKLNSDGTITNDGDALNIAFLLTTYTEDYDANPPTEYLRIERIIEPRTTYVLESTVEIEGDGISNVDEYNSYFRVRRIDGEDSYDFMRESTGETEYFILVDNRTAYTPIPGATFLLNPKTRNNSEEMPNRILNALDNNKEIQSSWEGFSFINDGWITSEDGQKVLRVPAGAKLTIYRHLWSQFITNPASSLTFDIDFTIRNVTNVSDPIIDIAEDIVETGGFKGFRMNSLDGWLCTSSYSEKNDCLFSWQEGVRTFLTVNIHHQVKPNKGDVKYPETAVNAEGTIALARILINGDCVREIPFNATSKDEWASSNIPIVIGNSGAVIDIHSIRIYENKQVDMIDILNKNYLSSLPDTETKNKTFNRNNVLTSGKIDIEKIKQLGINCMVWHGTLPYYYIQSEQKGWMEYFRYDDDGNYLPEYSGTNCKETKSLVGKGQGSTAKTYYDWNLQDDNSKVSATIRVALKDFHESINVSSPYTEDGKQYVDIYGGNLGKNFPIETKTKPYPYDNGYVTVPDGWIDGNGKYRGLGYMVSPDTSLAQKKVIKINYASSMQSHLIGACKTYDLLHRKVVGNTPIQDKVPTAVSAKYTEPFMFFNQEEGSMDTFFKGMGTYGAGKMDKVTWGYVKSLQPMFTLIEGSDNNLPMTGFRVPFDKKTAIYSPKDEGWLYAGQQSFDFDAGATTEDLTDGWEYSGTGEVPKANIRDKWAEVHNFIYLHSSNIKYYNGTYHQFKNSTQARDTNSKYWCTQGNEAYQLYRYDYLNDDWVNAGLLDSTGNYKIVNLKTDTITKKAYEDNVSTGNYATINIAFNNAMVAHMKEYIDYFINSESLRFNYVYVLAFLAGTDNSDKNTYYKLMPYGVSLKENSEFASWYTEVFGGTFDFQNVYQIYLDGDDMDSILRTNNNSHQTKPYYIDRLHPYAEDNEEDCLYEGMSNQLFNFVEKAYEDTNELADMLNRVLVAATELVNNEDNLVGLNSDKKSVWGFLHKYFFNIQNYFPQIAYLEQARIRYEFPQLIGFISQGGGARNISPISQSLGSQLQNELQYMNQRLIYMASYAGFGSFGGQTSYSIGLSDANDTFSFTPSANPDGSAATYIFNIQPHQYIYPSYNVGTTYTNTRKRLSPSEVYAMTIAKNITGSDTGMGICGINYYKSIGNLGDMSVVSGTLTISGKRLVEFYANPTKLYDGQSAFRPKQLKVEALQLEIFDINGSNSINLNLDLSKQSRLTKIDTTDTQVIKVIFPESTTLEEINLGAFTTELKIKNLPKLKTVNFEGYDKLKAIVIGENVNVDTQNLFTILWTKNTSLNEAEVHGINWIGVNSGLISWLADVKNPNITGTINIQEPSTTTSSIDFELKNKIISVFGNVDDLSSDYSKGLKLIYNTIPLDFISLDGTYWNDGNNFKIVITPNNKNSNNQSYFNFSIGNITGNTKVSVDSFTGEVEIISLSKESSFVTISCSVETIIGDNLIESIETEVWDREARVGDYVYYDATFSGEYSLQKTLVAICFYTNPENRKQRLAVGVIWTDYDDYYKLHDYRGWGPENKTANLFTLTSNPTYSIADVPKLTNQTGPTPKYITVESYTGGENPDIDNFVQYPEGDSLKVSWVTLDQPLYGVAKGTTIPMGLHNTLILMEHRDKILTDDAIDAPIPRATNEETKLQNLKKILKDNISANNKELNTLYYCAASVCNAYEPTLKAGEVLSNKFVCGKWFLGTLGELTRFCYERYLNNTFDYAISKGYFKDSAFIRNGPYIQYHSSTEYGSNGCGAIYWNRDTQEFKSQSDGKEYRHLFRQFVEF